MCVVGNACHPLKTRMERAQKEIYRPKLINIVKTKFFDISSDFEL